MAWEDDFFKALTDPDDMGESEYTTLYEHLRCVVESAILGDDNPKTMVLGTLDEIRRHLPYFHSVAERMVAPWEPTPEKPNAHHG